MIILFITTTIFTVPVNAAIVIVIIVAKDPLIKF